MIVNHECPIVQSRECTGEDEGWVFVSRGATECTPADEDLVTIVRRAVDLASRKASLLAKVSREKVAMIVKIVNT